MGDSKDLGQGNNGDSSRIISDVLVFAVKVRWHAIPYPFKFKYHTNQGQFHWTMMVFKAKFKCVTSSTGEGKTLTGKTYRFS